jgi:hypothetical protein
LWGEFSSWASISSSFSLINMAFCLVNSLFARDPIECTFFTDSDFVDEAETQIWGYLWWNLLCDLCNFFSHGYHTETFAVYVYVSPYQVNTVTYFKWSCENRNTTKTGICVAVNHLQIWW